MNKTILFIFFSIIIILCILTINGIFMSNNHKQHNHKQHNHKQHNHKQHNHKQHNSEKPCRTNLTDLEYLYHMIPHHQVAVDISYILQKKTKNPFMQHILRKLIWVQNYEIQLMKHFLKKLPNKFTSNLKMNTNYIETVSDLTKPNTLTISNTYCDPHFFDPKKHMEHMKNMKINDEIYIKHMIPHHQVAVDMSKKLLQNTKNDFMITLAYRIIRTQQDEIILLNDLLQNVNNNYKSNNILE